QRPRHIGLDAVVDGMAGLILESRILESRIPDPQSSIVNPESAIPDPQSRILNLNPESSIRTRRSGDWGLTTPDRGCRIQDPGSKIPDRGLGIRDSRIHSLCGALPRS